LADDIFRLLVSGIVRWPKADWRNDILEKWGRIEIGSLGGFRFSSLALISLVSLFLELFLIRWVSSEIRVFAYFKSLVLIACFLGLPGLLSNEEEDQSGLYFGALVCMVWCYRIALDPVRHLMTNLSGFIGWFSDVHIWNRAYFKGNFFWGRRQLLWPYRS